MSSQVIFNSSHRQFPPQNRRSNIPAKLIRSLKFSWNTYLFNL